MLTVFEATDAAFPRRLGGYRMDEVEAVRSRLVITLAEAGRGVVRGLAIGARELEGATFSRSLRGYASDEVDAFLAHAAETLYELGIASGSGHKRVTAPELRHLRPRRELDGYLPGAVSNYFAKAAEALDAHHAGTGAQLTREQAERVEFPLRLLGYSCTDVEIACDRIVSTLSFYESRGPVDPLSEPGGDPPESL